MYIYTIKKSTKKTNYKICKFIGGDSIPSSSTLSSSIRSSTKRSSYSPSASLELPPTKFKFEKFIYTPSSSQTSTQTSSQISSQTLSSTFPRSLSLSSSLSSSPKINNVMYSLSKKLPPSRFKIVNDEEKSRWEDVIKESKKRQLNTSSTSSSAKPRSLKRMRLSSPVMLLSETDLDDNMSEVIKFLENQTPNAFVGGSEKEYVNHNGKKRLVRFDNKNKKYILFNSEKVYLK